MWGLIFFSVINIQRGFSDKCIIVEMRKTFLPFLTYNLLGPVYHEKWTPMRSGPPGPNLMGNGPMIFGPPLEIHYMK